MVAAAGYEVSSVHLSAFIKMARAMGVLERVLPTLSAGTRAVVERPSDARWYPAQVISELAEQVLAVAGGEVLEELNYRMTKESLGRLILPVLKVALAIAGNSPATIFSRLDDVLAVAMRGIRVEWTPQGPTAGTLRFVYPEAPPRSAESSWRGALRFGFELTRADGRVVRSTVEGGALVMELAWV
ncbi:MAG: hypothetical protein ACOZQL_30950 [Myxococcota bacterium]